MPGCKNWKKPELLTPNEMQAISYYAVKGCTTTELRQKFDLTISKANKCIYYGLQEMKNTYHERKMIDNIEASGIENELVHH